MTTQTQAAAEPAALSGTLDEFPAASVLELLARSRRTGVLAVDGEVQAELVLHDGAVVVGEGPECRGELVDLLFELMLAEQGGFAFRAGPDSAVPGTTTVAVAALVAEVRERVERWQEVAATIPSTASVVGLVPWLPEGAGDLTLTPLQWRVVALCDGRRSVAEITRLAGQSAFDVCALLHQLVSSGAAAVRPSLAEAQRR